MNHYFRLLNDNRAIAGRRFAVQSSSGADEATVYLYDAIVNDALEAEYWGGVAPEPFIRALRDIDAKTIRLRVNSPGGSVFAARAIEQALREHPARIVAHVDGLAASAATFVSLAADEVVMAPGAMWMIHKAWGLAIGNSDDLMETAALLEKIDGTLVKTYATKTGKPTATVEKWMRDETWFTADEAAEHGFADRVAEDSEANAFVAWNLAAFKHAPAQQQRQVPARAAGVAPVTPEQPRRANVAALLRRLDVAIRTT